MNEKQIYLTAEGAQKIRTEFEELTGTQRADLAKRLREAIKMGDLSENADYIAAKEEQAFLEGKILELEETLRRAVIIEEDGNKGIVSVGATVTIAEDGGAHEVYTVVGSKEANPREGQISNQSPIGSALLGKKSGDLVLVETPGGELALRVISIE